MYSFDQQIPLFPASFTKKNINAIDFSSLHIIAVASGNTVTLSYMKDFQLHQGFSFIAGDHPITALRFDKTNRFLIIGNSGNHLYLYDFQTRNFISKPHSRNMNLYVQQIELYENGFIVLYKTGQLTFYTLFEKKDSPTLLLNCTWEAKIPEQMTHFTIDPYRNDRLFLYGKNTSYFQIYTIKEVHKPPIPLSVPMEITDEKIQSAKFSYHIRDYLFFVTEDSIMLYNVELQTIIPLSHDQRNSSQLEDIIQFPTDHSKLLVIYKTGSLSLLHLQKPFNLFSVHNLNHTIQDQTLLSYRMSPLRDDFLVLNYDPLGLALFDIYSFRIISILPLYLDKITSFDTDGTYYVFGTEKGFLISGNAYNVNEKNVYNLSPNKRSLNDNSIFMSSLPSSDNIAESGNFTNDINDNNNDYFNISNSNSITFVSLNQAKSAIYYAKNDGSVGDVNLADKVIKKYHQYSIKSQRNKCIGNSNGALVIQRDPCVLGVFIDGREHLFTSNYRIIDFCFDDDEANSPTVSTSVSGSVMALLETHVAVFFNYSTENGITNVIRRMSLDKLMIPRCCAWYGKTFAFGTEDSFIHMFNYSKKTPVASKVLLNGYSVRNIKIYGQRIFALTSDNVLYGISNEKVVKCASSVAHFKMFNNYLLMVLSMHSSVYFIKLSDLKRLKLNDKSMPIPIQDKFDIHSLRNNPVLKFHPQETGIEDEPETEDENIDNQNQDETEKRDENNQSDSGDSEKSDKEKKIIMTKPIKQHKNAKICFYSKSSPVTNPVYLPSVWLYKTKVGFMDRHLAYLSRTARIFWLFLLDRPCFRYMHLYAESDSKQYDDAICDLIELGNITDIDPNYCYKTLLYANKTEESMKVFSKENPKSSTFLFHTILSTAALSFEEDGITEEQCARIKSAGISLIFNGKVSQGCLLLKLAKLDSVAVEYLLQMKLFHEAMKFIRSSNTITKEEKENACFYIACKIFNEVKQQIRKAMLFFLTAKEYLHALYCLFKLRKYDDAFIIKEYLLKNNLINKNDDEVDVNNENDNDMAKMQNENDLVKLSDGKYNINEKSQLFGRKLSVEKVCNAIDLMFAENLKKRNCDPAKFGVNINIEEMGDLQKDEQK
ncbi:hypothetical protein M9Y10_011429 [Tritrichomonas musculus]|uniref:RAVE complex protein Rav1 C-terminal domain-containing protein n=1 Tax=Tritrichomonas musculus TaxID=1915356 RepID=A0ABR2IKG3_9EUKA